MNKPSIDTLISKFKIDITNISKIIKKRKSVEFRMGKNMHIKFKNNQCIINIYISEPFKVYNYIYTLKETEILYLFYKYSQL